MQFATLLASASLIAATTAQIAFTTLPARVQAGVSTKLTWGGADDSQPVTITLKQGPPNNLVTVEIITGKATGTSFNWTPSKSLPNGNDYALQISQGPEDVNYSGEFSLTGGSAVQASSSSASSASSTVSSSASSISVISPASVTRSAAVSSAVSSLNDTVSSLVASISSSVSLISNATIATTTVAGTAAIGTAVGGSLSAATGTVMNRNTTMSSATLTRSKTASTTASTTSTEAASTGSDAAATSSSSTSDAMGLASPLAFVLFAAGAIVYLG